MTTARAVSAGIADARRGALVTEPEDTAMRTPFQIRIHPALVALLLFALAGHAVAQQAETFGPYEVHYSAINTSMLSPQVAQVYGIQRAGTRAMLNIAVLRAEDSVAVSGRVTASATNLTGQRREIEMREVRDQDAIYYIGTFRVHDEENLNFTVEIAPEGHSGAPYALSFRQQFFTD